MGGDVALLVSALQEKVWLATGNLNESPLRLNSICHHIWARGDDTLSQRADYGSVCRYLSALCLPVIPLSVCDPTQQLAFLPAKTTTNTEKHYRNIPEICKKCSADRHECEDEPCLQFRFSSSLTLFNFTVVWHQRELSRIGKMHIWRECSECKELYTSSFRNSLNSAVQNELGQGWWKTHIP